MSNPTPYPAIIDAAETLSVLIAGITPDDADFAEALPRHIARAEALAAQLKDLLPEAKGDVSVHPIPQRLSDDVTAWARRTYGQAALAVLVGRANREMADLIDDVAIGETGDLSRRVGNIAFVLTVIADDYGFTLSAALADAFADNLSHDWDVDAWGRGTKRKTGPVIEDEASAQLIAAVHAGALRPEQVVVIFCARGASFNAACQYVAAHCPDQPLPDGAFDPAKDLTPAARVVAPPRFTLRFAPLTGGRVITDLMGESYA